MQRRTFIKLMAALGVAGVWGVGLERAAQSAAARDFPSKPPVTGGQTPEAWIDLKTGAVSPTEGIVMRHSACLGCYSSCGNRVKIDLEHDRVLQVFGNPYNPNNTEPHLPYQAHLNEAYLAFSSHAGKGNTGRGALCGRGNATLQAHQDPMRTLFPFKRAGRRGEGKWKPITWEEAVQETVEGGRLFKEIGEDREIEGFRHVRDLKTPIDPNCPEFGPKANQLVFFGGRGDGRMIFASRFMNAFGSVNYFTHGST
ncbi:MAG: hypothetical protein ACOY9Y_01780 [Bacillota bacterium]